MGFSSGFAGAFQQPGVNQNTGAYYPQQTYTASSPQPQPVAPIGVSVGGGGGGGGDGGALATIAASMAADQAARLVYQEWQMRTGDERLAMEKAQQAWSQTFSERQQTFSEGYQTAGLLGTFEGQATLPRLAQEAGYLGTYNGQQTQQAQQQAFAQDLANRQQALDAAGVTGQYQGAPTLAAQGQQQQGALGLLGLQSQLQGPRDWHRYWQLSASAPQGLQSALSSLAGRYQYAPGAQGTPGPATLGSRTQDLLSGGNLGTGGQGGAAGTGGAGAGQAGNAWQWNLQNYARMAPSMQQGVLGAAEAGGAYGPDVEALLRQAAPRYTGPTGANVSL